MSEQVKIKLITADQNESTYWSFIGKNLWESMAMSGIDTGGSCGGNGTCGKCKVRVEGNINDISDSERRQLLAEEIKSGIRLACHCNVNGPVTIYMDSSVNDMNNNLKINKKATFSPLHAQVQYRKILIPGMIRENPIPIYKRLANSLTGYKLELSINNLNDLALMDRAERPALELHALIMNNQVVKYIGRKKEKACGIALDLGSTSLYAALIDLETGDNLAISNKPNMQRVYGADIISRLSYCLENTDGLEKLCRILINNVNAMIEELLEEAHLCKENIYRMTAAGNPVMLHLFMGLNPAGFALAPYSGLFADEICFPAAEVGLLSRPDAELLILPQIGGFVGADTVACLLTIPQRAAERFLLIDIGTNGEIVLGDHGRMWAVSAAAGPAFEGGGISSGMRAGNGAIDKIYLNEEEKLAYQVLGGGPARGICGSAIIDITGALLEASYIDENGIISPAAWSSLNIREGEHGAEIILAEGEQTYRGTPLLFKQEDIRQVQLAKAAFRTAIDILLKESGLNYESLDRVYLAGAFGNYLDPRYLIAIGMIPSVSTQKVRNIGNAAAEGAILALFSLDKQREARQIKEQVRYIELASYPGFQSMYLGNINFPVT